MILTATLTGFITSAGLIVAIGAQNAYVLRQGLLRQYVGQVVAFCTLADTVLILCGVAGIGVLVEAFPDVLDVLRYAGAVFLAFYGAMAARRALSGTSHLSAQEGAGHSLKSVLLTCFAFTFLNPHVYLDTMILLGGVSTRYSGISRWAFAAGACAASVCWFCCLGFGARLLQPVFRRAGAWRVLDGGIAMFMFLLVGLLVWYPVD